MSINVYFVRHGESEGNKKQVYQREDVPLSEKGKEQGVLAVLFRSPNPLGQETKRSFITTQD